VALVSLVVPLLLGMAGRPLPELPRVRLGEAVRGRGGATHLALARLTATGLAEPLGHAGSAMLRGLAGADGFVVIAPETQGAPGDEVPFVPLPVTAGELASRPRPATLAEPGNATPQATAGGHP
jgi:molybdopterin molybdotransferase